MGEADGNGRDDFLSCFAETFQARCQREADDLMRRFASRKDWTHLMLGEPNGVLRGAACHWADKRLGCGRYSPHTEWYTIDLSVVAPPSAQGRYWEGSTLLAIEHENGDDVETEMWKLTHWRSDLSVLVFYDFSEDDVASDATYAGDKTLPGVRKSVWLNEKRELLSGIVRRSEAIGPLRHLLLIGQRTSTQGVRWRYSVWENDQFCSPKALA